MVDVNTLYIVLANTLTPFGDHFRQAEYELARLETEPEFITGLLAVILEGQVELGVKRAAAVYLKNKIARSWGSREAAALSDADKSTFKQQLIPAMVVCHPQLREFLLVCLAAILSYDFHEKKWPELLPQVRELLQNPADLPGICAGLKILKQVCKFYRWNTVQTSKELGPLLQDIYPHLLSISEAALALLPSEVSVYYELIYGILKIYKLSTTRFLPAVLREESVAKRTTSLFLQVFALPLPAFVLSVFPPSERANLLPVKCVKWVTGNIARTHNTYLTKQYTQLSENSASYAPYRSMSLDLFAPQITKQYLERLQQWSQQQCWLSDKSIYSIISYLNSMIDIKPVFTMHIEPQLRGLLSQVLFPLLCPTEDDFDLFEDDSTEFSQRKVDYNNILTTPLNVASEFIGKVVRKRKNTLPIVVQFLQECASKIGNSNDQITVKHTVGLFNLVQALAAIFLNKNSALHDQLEPFLATYILPAFSSSSPFLRCEACETATKLGTIKLESRETMQQLFNGVLACFFDSEHLPVQVAAAQTLQALSLQEYNEDVRSAMGEHITDIIRNLLTITQKIDLEPLLTVLDNFVEQFPKQIIPFATGLANQLCSQFIFLTSEIQESQRQIDQGNRVAESELMIANDEKIAAGYGIINSLANLQNNLEHESELIAKLDQTISPVFLAVYENQLTDFYPDCLSLHENTLFILKRVPKHHWQLFDLILLILKQSNSDYLDDAMPVLENYILYGAGDLAAMPEKLSAFAEVLISLYGASSDTSNGGVSFEFSESRSRSHAMGVATKLLVSSGLFNGPLIPLVPSLVSAVLKRVSQDAQKNSNFPPRYNVSTISVVLGGLYHYPEGTLAILQQNSALNSFLETWFDTANEFVRINDLKLCTMSILSLLSHASAHPNFDIPQLSRLLDTLVYALEAMPGAASRMEELLKNERDTDWNDDEWEYGEEDDVDSQDDEESQDASAAYQDEVPNGIAMNGTGDGMFMYEQPGANQETQSAEEDDSAASQLRNTLFTQMGFRSDDFEEDLYNVSPLDNLNPYDALRTVIYGIQQSKATFYQKMIESLSESGKGVLDRSLQRQALSNNAYETK